MNDPIFLTLDEVLQLQAEALEHFGGAEGVIDIGLIESAIAQPQMGFGGQYLHPTFAAMAGAYLFHLASNHGFRDGNKRVGMRAAIVFLAMNGFDVDVPVDEAEELTLRIAAGEGNKDVAIEFFTKLLGRALL